MKKFLLMATAALATSSAFAATDGQTYDVTNDIKCQNIWVVDRFHTPDVFKSIAEGRMVTNDARTACLSNGVIYVGNSTADDPEVTTTAEDGTVSLLFAGSIDKFSMVDGSYLGRIKLMLDGQRYTGQLCANQVGVDSFGNFWVAGYVSSNKQGYKVYSVDLNTGVMTLQLNGTMTNDSRIDYCDVIGDITRTQAKCIVMAAGSSTNFVFRWAAEQGEDFAGGFDGDDSLSCMEMYPAEQTLWGTAPSIKIVLGEDDAAYDAELFYIDGFTTYPALYNPTLSIADSFEKAPDLTPEAGANGACEFTVNGKNFLAYPWEQYSKEGQGCRVSICELGEGMQFTGMTRYWQIPADGLGSTSDGGTRIHSIDREIVKDANGKEGAYVLTYKAQNGIGVYLVADKDFNPAGVEDAIAGSSATINVSAGMITVSEEASEIAIFNVAGQMVAKVNNASEIAAPAATGVYVIKATVNGSQIVKKAVVK